MSCGVMVGGAVCVSCWMMVGGLFGYAVGVLG